MRRRAQDAPSAHRSAKRDRSCYRSVFGAVNHAARRKSMHPDPSPGSSAPTSAVSSAASANAANLWITSGSARRILVHSSNSVRIWSHSEGSRLFLLGAPFFLKLTFLSTYLANFQFEISASKSETSAPQATQGVPRRYRTEGHEIDTSDSPICRRGLDARSACSKRKRARRNPANLRTRRYRSLP